MITIAKKNTIKLYQAVTQGSPIFFWQKQQHFSVKKKRTLLIDFYHKYEVRLNRFLSMS